MATARAAKESIRLNGPVPDYCTWIPPRLRRQIIVIDYDFGKPVVHKMKLYRTGRIDRYRIEVDGKHWKNAGWSKAVEGIRKSFLRVKSIS